jgi:DNA-binding transcriptional ArsR family regulator
MDLNIIEKTKLDNQALDAQTQVFKVLTHPARIAILNILRDGEHCVCHMEAYLGYRQSYISQQIAVLREAGLIQDRRDGWNIFYRVVNPDIYAVLDAVQKFVGMEPNNAHVASVNCNCPHYLAKRGSV